MKGLIKSRKAERDYCESGKPERQNSEIPSTIHLNVLCEPFDHIRDFVIMNFYNVGVMMTRRKKNQEIPLVVRLTKEGIRLWSFVNR
jgi:hypothetical protein